MKKVHTDFKYSSAMGNVLKSDGIEAKRKILSSLGSNLIWNDKELNIFNDIAIEKLVEGIKHAKELNPKFEPKNFLAIKHSKEKTDEFLSVFSTMLPLVDRFRTLNWVAINREFGLLPSLVTKFQVHL